MYLVPLYPLLAVACGAGLASWLRVADAASVWLRRSLGGAVAAALLAAPGSLAVERLVGLALPAWLAPVLAGGPLAAFAAERALRRRLPERTRLVAVTIGGLVFLEATVFAGVYPALDARNSPRPVATFARRETPAGAAIAVYRNETLASGVAYYARRPVRHLRRPEQVAGYFAGGGRALVVEEDDLAEVPGAAALREAGEGRSRQRRLLVLAPHDPRAQ